MGQQRNWTTEEKDLLEKYWGNKSVTTIAKKLNRSVNAINVMKNRLGLGAFLESGEYVTMHQLLLAIGITGGDGYKNKSWIENRDFPVKRIRVESNKFKVVYIEDFWKWAEQNKAFLDFSKFDEYALGKEPEWVKQKRKDDFKRSIEIKSDPWSCAEDSKLILLLNQYKFTCRELSQKLNRTEGAIIRRISELELVQRPIKEDNHRLYSDEDYFQLGELIKAGCKYEQIASELNRSVKAIRGRVFDMYFTEQLDKVRQYIGNGRWGDGRPEPSIRYMRVMTSDKKEEAKDLLGTFAGLILEHAKINSGVSDEYKEFFQKDMCLNWDNIKGCTANEKSCDTCNQFQRIPPQYCQRCGTAFLSKRIEKICEPCRIQRKKQAQRKYAVLNSRNKWK